MKKSLLEFGVSTVAGVIEVFNYDSHSREVLPSTVEFLPVGVGIPANSCLDKPPKKRRGFAICRTIEGTEWEYVEDHRGEIIWRTNDCYAVNIILLGDYPADTTTISPETPYDTWDGVKWVTDNEMKKVSDIKDAELNKQSLIFSAGERINLLYDAIDIGIATDDERGRYDDWRKYRVLLSRIDASLAPNITWPEPPKN